MRIIFCSVLLWQIYLTLEFWSDSWYIGGIGAHFIKNNVLRYSRGGNHRLEGDYQRGLPGILNGLNFGRNFCDQEHSDLQCLQLMIYWPHWSQKGVPDIAGYGADRELGWVISGRGYEGYRRIRELIRRRRVGKDGPYPPLSGWQLVPAPCPGGKGKQNRGEYRSPGRVICGVGARHHL